MEDIGYIDYTYSAAWLLGLKAGQTGDYFANNPYYVTLGQTTDDVSYDEWNRGYFLGSNLKKVDLDVVLDGTTDLSHILNFDQQKSLTGWDQFIIPTPNTVLLTDPERSISYYIGFNSARNINDLTPANNPYITDDGLGNITVVLGASDWLDGFNAALPNYPLR